MVVTPAKAVAAGDLIAARQGLADARADLDAAVATLAGGRGDAIMATPALLALLVQAVEAKGHVDDLEVAIIAQRAGATSPFETGHLKLAAQIVRNA